MATRVFWHLGLPKSGTTYLQDALWDGRDALADAGVVLPGARRREHLWAALEVAGLPLRGRDPRVPGTWARLLDDVASSQGDVVLSHEFFCAAATDRAAEAVAALTARADEVHLVLTARHPAATLAAGWQERVKNGGEEDLPGLAGASAADEGDRAGSELGWRTWDLAGVLERWGGLVAAERVHVLPVAASSDRPDPRDLWRRWCSVLGVDPAVVDVPAEPANPSLGLVGTELLRRVNAHLGELKRRAVDRGDWIRGVLAEQHLRALVAAPVPIELPADVLADCRERGRRARALVEDLGVDVVGDPDDLVVPDDIAAAAPGVPGAVDDADLLDVATRLVAALLLDLREARGGAGESAQ